IRACHPRLRRPPGKRAGRRTPEAAARLRSSRAATGRRTHQGARDAGIVETREEPRMVAHARPVGPGRYRESHGRYFEEFELGAVYEHRPGRTITEADNIQFSLLTMNFHPLHCDNAYGAQSEFGRCIVNSALTFAIVLGLSVADVSAKAIANLGIDKLRLIAPVFPGDTIYAESEVIAKRESESRPTQGLVTVRTTGRKADGTVFLTFERTALIPRRGYAVEDRADG